MPARPEVVAKQDPRRRVTVETSHGDAWRIGTDFQGLGQAIGAGEGEGGAFAGEFACGVALCRRSTSFAERKNQARLSNVNHDPSCLPDNCFERVGRFSERRARSQRRSLRDDATRRWGSLTTPRSESKKSVRSALTYETPCHSNQGSIGENHPESEEGGVR